MAVWQTPRVVVEGEHAFWEVPCPNCGETVTECLLYEEADCERCAARVKVDLAKGEA